VIDAHHHLWDVSAREHRWLMGGQSWASDEELARLRRSFGLADLAALAAASGVTGTVVIQTVAEPWETPDLLTLAAGGDPYGGGGAGAAGTGTGRGLLAGVVGWTDLTAADVTEAVAGLRALRGGAFLCGIRHPVLAEPDPDWLARPSVLCGLSGLAGSGLCFDVVVAPHQLAAAVTAVRSVPGLTFVLDHLGSPPVGSDTAGAWALWSQAIAELGALPNVVCKLSGAHSSPVLASDLRPAYETVLAAFGPSRLMFGSDWPVSSLTAPYGEVCALYRELAAELSSAEQGAIFSGTAHRVYGLRLPSRARASGPGPAALAYQPRPA
jgi:predicted TIM-barrel fold metal-dependent hydrolase